MDGKKKKRNWKEGKERDYLATKEERQGNAENERERETDRETERETTSRKFEKFDVNMIGVGGPRPTLLFRLYKRTISCKLSPQHHVVLSN